MSKKRMFSPDILESDAFLDMPLTSQILYVHLNMNADDDGFVNPKRIMRMIGAGNDDLQVLIAKRFLLTFNSGVVVVKHWLIHNLIRPDAYHETTYKDEKRALGLNDNGAYTELRAGVSKIKQIEAPDWLKKRRGEKIIDEKPLSARNRPDSVPQSGLEVRLDKVSNNVGTKSRVSEIKKASGRGKSVTLGAKIAPTAKKTQKPDSIVAKLYYEAIGALDVPVRNHNNVHDKIREMEAEADQWKVINYLTFMRDTYPDLVMERKPHINEALDIYAKRKQIRNLLELEQRKKAGARYE